MHIQDVDVDNQQVNRKACNFMHRRRCLCIQPPPEHKTSPAPPLWPSLRVPLLPWQSTTVCFLSTAFCLSYHMLRKNVVLFKDAPRPRTFEPLRASLESCIFSVPENKPILVKFLYGSSKISAFQRRYGVMAHHTVKDGYLPVGDHN